MFLICRNDEADTRDFSILPRILKRKSRQLISFFLSFPLPSLFFYFILVVFIRFPWKRRFISDRLSAKKKKEKKITLSRLYARPV